MLFPWISTWLLLLCSSSLCASATCASRLPLIALFAITTPYRWPPFYLGTLSALIQLGFSSSIALGSSSLIQKLLMYSVFCLLSLFHWNVNPQVRISFFGSLVSPKHLEQSQHPAPSLVSHSVFSNIRKHLVSLPLHHSPVPHLPGGTPEAWQVK